jgi:hypothetical protein
MRPCIGPGGLPGGQALTDLRQAFGDLPLFRQCPPALDRCLDQKLRKALLLGQHDRGVGPCAHLGRLPEEPMQARCARQHKDHVEGVCQRLSPRQRLGAPLPGLVWIAQRPQGLGAKDAAPHPGVIPKAEHVGPVL